MQYETLVRADREVRKYLSKVALKEESPRGSLEEDCSEDDVDSYLGGDEVSEESSSQELKDSWDDDEDGCGDEETDWGDTGLSKEDESVLDKTFRSDSNEELPWGNPSQCKDIFSCAPADSIFDSCQGNSFGAGEPIESDYCPDFYATDDESREDFASGFVYAIMISMGIQDDQFAHNAEIIAQAEFIKD